MNTRVQSDLVSSLLRSRGFDVHAEVPLGPGLWKGIRADFVVNGIDEYPDGLAIECKWQSSSGSAAEKLAYLVLNITRHYPIPCLILCSGSELGPAKHWAAGEVHGSRLIAVYDTDEFIEWVGRLKAP